MKQKRIGLLKVDCGSDPDVLRIVRGAVGVFERCGVDVVDVEEDFLDCEKLLRENNLIRFEQKRSVEEYLSDEENGMTLCSFKAYLDSGMVARDALKPLLVSFEFGSAGHEAEYRRRLCRRDETLRKTLGLMEAQKLDALLYPSQRILSVPVGAPEGQAGRNGIIASNLGLPALSFPAGFSAPSTTAPLGLPIGMELLGVPFSEKFLLAAAAVFEAAMPVRRPPCGFPDLR